MASQEMTVTKATKNPVAAVRTFFVQSENDEQKQYVVVEIKRDGTQYYCNCGDFFFRKLPFIGTNLYSNCKHINAVIDAIGGGK